MATVKFNLRGKGRAKAQPISLIFRHKGLRVVYSTGLKVIPKYWSNERQRVKNVASVTDKDQINNVLNQLQAEVKRWAVERLDERDGITSEKLKQHLDHFTGRRSGPAKEFLPYFAAFVEDAPNRILPTSGKPPTLSTIKQYKTTLNTLKKFADVSRRPVAFRTIDEKFYNEFVSWMQSRGAAHNTIGKHIKVFKTILNAATDDGVNDNLTFRSKAFRGIKEDVQNIYLPVDELDKLAKIDLSQNERLARVRDLFLLGAWTGLRFSDFTQIAPGNIQGENIRIKQQKTGRVVVVPILPVVAGILEKYKGFAPPGISNQKMNQYLKEIGQLAGLDDLILRSQTRGGARVSMKARKWELLTTHTARRSFATNAYLRGIPTVSIMQITGHKSETAFLKYIKVSQEKHAEIVRSYWTIKPTPHLKAV